MGKPILKITVRILACAVIFSGLAVIAGWEFGVPGLLSVYSGWMNIKFNTAVVFVFSGILLYFIARSREGDVDKAQVMIPIVSLVIILFIGTSFFSSILGIRTGVEDLFIEGQTGSITAVAGKPSMPMMLGFLLIASAGLLTVAGAKKISLKLKVTGLILVLIGAAAAAGYLFNFPPLYYYIKGINSGMAFYTAVLFILLGGGLLCL